MKNNETKTDTWPEAKAELDRTGKDISATQAESAALARDPKFIIPEVKDTEAEAERLRLAIEQNEAQRQAAIKKQLEHDKNVADYERKASELERGKIRLNDARNGIAACEEILESWTQNERSHGPLFMRQALDGLRSQKHEVEFLEGWIERAGQRLKKSRADLAAFCREHQIANPLKEN